MQIQPVTVYEALLGIGAVGFITMSLTGAAGRHSVGRGAGGHGHGAFGARAGHGGHAPAAAHGHAVAARAGVSGRAGVAGRAGARQGEGGAMPPVLLILGIVSPLTIFSVALGAGAAGLALGSRFSVAITALIAAIAGIALFALFVRPYMALMSRFVSNPATALEGTIAKEAVAQNRFDARGRGIVTVDVDGQLVRLLAYLETDDAAKGIAVAPGDRLVVTHIEEAKNTCRVTKI